MIIAMILIKAKATIACSCTQGQVIHILDSSYIIIIIIIIIITIIMTIIIFIIVGDVAVTILEL